MSITIQEFSAQNRHDINRCNGAFVVDSKLVMQVENGVPSYTLVRVPPYQKHYAQSEITFESYASQREKGVYFAYVDGVLAGQIILSSNWNGYAYVDDIAVDASFRKQGIGRALIQQAITWAKAKQLPGIMLETQNVNVAACLFYQRCGFELGGFDRYLYRAVDPQTTEVALFWYLRF